MHQQRSGISDCPESYAKWYCLNGATCFAIEVRNTTLYNCWCPAGFQGLRCDYKYPELRNESTLADRNKLDNIETDADYSDGNQLIVAEKTGTQVEHRQEIHLILLYNLISLLLIVILIFLLLRLFRLLVGRWDSLRLRQEQTADRVSTPASSSDNPRLDLFEGTIGRPKSIGTDSGQSDNLQKANTRDGGEKNGQINHDSILVGLDMITQAGQTDTGESNQIHRSHRQQDASKINGRPEHLHGLQVSSLKNELQLEVQQQFAFSLLSADYDPTIYLARNYNSNCWNRKPV